MRVQFTIDDNLGHELQHQAEDLGLSVSSYIRSIVKKAMKKPNAIDLAMSEPSEKISLEEFKKQIHDLM